MKFAVRVYFESFGDHSPPQIIGQVRRLADDFGRPGIEAKRGQTNNQALRKGHLRLVWPTRQLARDYQAAVAEFWGDYVSTRRFKNRER